MDLLAQVNYYTRIMEKMDYNSRPLPPFYGLLPADLIPYAILVVNFIIFQLLRSFMSKLFEYCLIEDTTKRESGNKSATAAILSKELGGKSRLLKLLIDELISTCELCADCAELNVVYEKHGSFMYGLSLFILTYFWLDTFGDAHTTPGYLFEEYFLDKGNNLLRKADTYVRFVGQSMAMPLAWKFASLYWSYKLLAEHREMLLPENCKTSLTTSTLNGFLIELICCLLCRLFELFGNKLLHNNTLGKRCINLACSFLCTALVVCALEVSGGYFNPVLASSLEYGCKGINFYQHVIVFWIGPLLGHVLARFTFRKLSEEEFRKEEIHQGSRKLQRSKSKSKLETGVGLQVKAPTRAGTRSSRKKRD